MRAAQVLIVLTSVALGPLSTTSCSVDRQSSDFACTSDDDCKDATRTCDHGYCVERASGNDCPSPCTSCDLGELTCDIVCSASRPCGSLQCPLGFACTIKCNNANACETIDCGLSASCDISCSGAMACGPVNCGIGECSVACAGASACQNIDCFTSCACDVRCNSATACPPPSCPISLGECTRGGAPDATCDSTQPGCDRCP